tara:strand:+ start:603 stop:944 length:342 start_codon:yes stop_codon:yes gene_type:complete
MKICNQCGIEKDLKCFANNRTSTGEQYRRAKCNACRNKNQKTGLYYVYYLPNENYCGITDYLTRRLSKHKRVGKNIENYHVLYISRDKKQAAYHEALYQSTLCMEGLALTMYN